MENRSNITVSPICVCLSLSRLTSGSIFPDCLAIESKASVTSRSNCSEVPRAGGGGGGQ